MESALPARPGHPAAAGVDAKATVAAINGYALGGGLELCYVAAPLRVAAGTGKFGLPREDRRLSRQRGTQRFAGAWWGRARALEMMLTGKIIEAAEAERIGLVNHVVPRANLLGFCRSLLRTIVENAPVAAALILECVDGDYRCGYGRGAAFRSGGLGRRGGQRGPARKARGHSSRSAGPCFAEGDG